jgi:NAD(P)-dependent dehydrogenase (short-subunit alcohol dehydrogenase family)
LNKVALVTGGVRRLGRYISYFLAEESYDLAIIYNSSSLKELKKTTDCLNKRNIMFRFYKCDLRDLNQLKKNIYKIGREFKKIDLLINNAGIIQKVEFKDISQKLFDDTININLRAALFTSKYCLKYLVKAEKPSIINIASLGGLQNWGNYFPYSISKTAVIKLTYLLAKKLAPQIRVNAIAPGTIIIEGEEKDTPEKTLLERIPLKRYGKPLDIIEAIRFLINDEYITGQVIVVDGGRMLN